MLKQDQHLGEKRSKERTENIGLVLPLMAASSSVTRKTARRSVPILADSKTVTELQRNHVLSYQHESVEMSLKRKCNRLHKGLY